MRTAPENWSEYRENSLYETEYRVTIAGVIYDRDTIDSDNLNISRLLFSDKLSLGNVTVATLNCTIFPSGVIPKMAQILVESRTVLNGLGTAWIAEGTFFIDTREELSDGWLSITAYDDALKMEQDFLNPELEKGEWPITMQAAAAEVATRIGVLLDTRNAIPAAYMMEYPNELTMREVMANIAAACGGNWVITPDRTLYLCPVKLSETPALTIEEDDPVDFSITGDINTISKVVCIYSEDGNYYEAGDDTGFELEVNCLWATQQITNALLEQLQGFVYVPFSLSHKLNPLLDLGDTISYRGNLLYVANVYMEMSDGDYSTISAPGEKTINHEYPYVGTVQRSLSRKVTLGGNYFGVSISRKNGLQIKKTNGETVSGEALFNSDVLSMRAMVDGVMKDVIYFDTATGKYKITGDVLIEGAVQSDASITDALYAEQGDISQLTVDRLETSDKIRKYLMSDPSQIQFIRIEGLALQFIIANVKLDDGAPVVEQLENRYGSLVYWKKDISNATIINGYPYVDDVRVYTTEEDTGYPVMVYKYNEAVVRQIMFEYDAYTGFYFCTETFGQGSGVSETTGKTHNQGYMQKSDTSFFLKYRTSNGKEIGIQMNNDGYTDVYGLRKTTGLNFSEWDRGVFYELIDGDTERYHYYVEFDSEDRPIKITDSDEHVLYITW